MFMKPILAILASALTGFFLGWLIFGLALAGFYEANITHYDGLMNAEPAMWGYVVGNLLLGGLFVYIFHWLADIKEFGKGFIAGLVITCLVMTTMDIYFFTGMNLFSGTLVIVDIIANTVLGGVMGGVAALVLGSGKKA
jgi:hypothetical protein